MQSFPRGAPQLPAQPRGEIRWLARPPARPRRLVEVAKELVLEAQREARLPRLRGGVEVNDARLLQDFSAAGRISVGTEQVHRHVPSRLELTPISGDDRVERFLIVPAQMLVGDIEVDHRSKRDVLAAPLREIDEHHAGVEELELRGKPELTVKCNACARGHEARRGRELRHREQRRRVQIPVPEIGQVADHDEVTVEIDHPLERLREHVGQEQPVVRLQRDGIEAAQRRAQRAQPVAADVDPIDPHTVGIHGGFDLSFEIDGQVTLQNMNASLSGKAPDSRIPRQG